MSYGRNKYFMCCFSYFASKYWLLLTYRWLQRFFELPDDDRAKISVTLLTYLILLIMCMYQQKLSNSIVNNRIVSSGFNDLPFLSVLCTQSTETSSRPARSSAESCGSHLLHQFSCCGRGQTTEDCKGNFPNICLLISLPGRNLCCFLFFKLQQTTGN